jgi:hypothetical protein
MHGSVRNRTVREAGIILTSRGQHQSFSDDTIRRFFLSQLPVSRQEEFEAALFVDSQLEQRARLAEIALIDDCVLGHLKANDRNAFQKEFLVTPARGRKLEVSNALRQTFAVENVSQPARSSIAQRLFAWQAFAWRIAFAIVVLMVLFASALVIRREPQIVKRIIPKRLRPAAVVTPTPQAANHATTSSDSPVHRDEPPPLPAHEASPQTMVLRANMRADDAPIVDLTNNAAKAVRLELMLERKESATFHAIVATIGGEIVYDVREINAQDTDRLNFDLPVERLKPGNFQITLKRSDGETSVVGNYYFRVQ